MDMISCTRQMVEKAIEHREQLFLVFVDLRKAYNPSCQLATVLPVQPSGVHSTTGPSW